MSDKNEPIDEESEVFTEPLSTKATTPKAKGFNLKIIGAIVLTIALTVFLALQFNVLGKKKKTPDEIEKEKNEQTATATPQAMQGIDAVNRLPATYQNPNLQQPQNLPQQPNGPTSNQELLAAQQKATTQAQAQQPGTGNPYSNTPQYNYSGTNGQQPQLPAPSPEQQAMFEEKRRKQQKDEERLEKRDSEERERFRMIDQERKQALSSPIKFNISATNSTVNATAGTQAQNGTKPPNFQMPDIKMPEIGQSDPNQQKDKKAFLDAERNKPNFLKAGLNYPVSPYQLMAGTIIPATMITGLNSDLPGQIVGQVRENVYDSVNGHFLLIPQGTKIIGEYSSNVTFGQDRVLIIWTRLIFRDGTSINLEGMPGVDLSGYAGTSDKVNNHFIKIATGAVFSSVMGASIKLAAGNQDAGSANFSQLAASGAAQSMGQAADKFLSKMMDQQPTIEIRPGTKFNVFVNKDIILKSFRR